MGARGERRQPRRILGVMAGSFICPYHWISPFIRYFSFSFLLLCSFVFIHFLSFISFVFLLSILFLAEIFR